MDFPFFSGKNPADLVRKINVLFNLDSVPMSERIASARPYWEDSADAKVCRWYGYLTETPGYVNWQEFCDIAILQFGSDEEREDIIKLREAEAEQLATGSGEAELEDFRIDEDCGSTRDDDQSGTSIHYERRSDTGDIDDADEINLKQRLTVGDHHGGDTSNFGQGGVHGGATAGFRRISVTSDSRSGRTELGKSGDGRTERNRLEESVHLEGSLDSCHGIGGAQLSFRRQTETVGDGPGSSNLWRPKFEQEYSAPAPSEAQASISYEDLPGKSCLPAFDIPEDVCMNGGCDEFDRSSNCFDPGIIVRSMRYLDGKLEFEMTEAYETSGESNMGFVCDNAYENHESTCVSSNPEIFTVERMMLDIFSDECESVVSYDQYLDEHCSVCLDGAFDGGIDIIEDAIFVDDEPVEVSPVSSDVVNATSMSSSILCPARKCEISLINSARIFESVQGCCVDFSKELKFYSQENGSVSGGSVKLSIFKCFDPGISNPDITLDVLGLKGWNMMNDILPKFVVRGAVKDDMVSMYGYLDEALEFLKCSLEYKLEETRIWTSFIWWFDPGIVLPFLGISMNDLTESMGIGLLLDDFQGLQKWFGLEFVQNEVKNKICPNCFQCFCGLKRESKNYFGGYCMWSYRIKKINACFLGVLAHECPGGCYGFIAHNIDTCLHSWVIFGTILAAQHSKKSVSESFSIREKNVAALFLWRTPIVEGVLHHEKNKKPAYNKFRTEEAEKLIGLIMCFDPGIVVTCLKRYREIYVGDVADQQILLRKTKWKPLYAVFRAGVSVLSYSCDCDCSLLSTNGLQELSQISKHELQLQKQCHRSITNGILVGTDEAQERSVVPVQNELKQDIKSGDSSTEQPYNFMPIIKLWNLQQLQIWGSCVVLLLQVNYFSAGLFSISVNFSLRSSCLLKRRGIPAVQGKDVYVVHFMCFRRAPVKEDKTRGLTSGLMKLKATRRRLAIPVSKSHMGESPVHYLGRSAPFHENVSHSPTKVAKNEAHLLESQMNFNTGCKRKGIHAKDPAFQEHQCKENEYSSAQQVTNLPKPWSENVTVFKGGTKLEIKSPFSPNRYHEHLPNLYSQTISILLLQIDDYSFRSIPKLEDKLVLNREGLSQPHPSPRVDWSFILVMLTIDWELLTVDWEL